MVASPLSYQSGWAISSTNPSVGNARFYSNPFSPIFSLIYARST